MIKFPKIDFFFFKQEELINPKKALILSGKKKKTHWNVLNRIHSSLRKGLSEVGWVGRLSLTPDDISRYQPMLRNPVLIPAGKSPITQN